MILARRIFGQKNGDFDELPISLLFEIPKVADFKHIVVVAIRVLYNAISMHC